MTVAKSLAQWLESNGLGTVGTDIFIGSVPDQAPVPCYWILGGGGSPSIRNKTGEKVKNYIFSVFYRNTDSDDVDEKLQALEEKANSKACHDLDGYETVDLEASGFQTDQDLDAEDRTLGSVEISVSVYQSQ